MKKNLFLEIILLTLILLMIFCTMVNAAENIVENMLENTVQNNLIEDDIIIEYEYNQNENQMMVKIISNIPLKDTKPTWELSEDKLVYTKIFTSNIDYETPVEDEYGNVTNVSIKITQIKEFKIEMKYEYNAKKGQVTAKMISNIKLKHTKPTWELSDDKLTYTKVFTENTTYTTLVEDIYGNVINAIININHLKATIDVEYEYNSNTNQVAVKIVSDVQLQHTKPTWELS